MRVRNEDDLLEDCDDRTYLIVRTLREIVDAILYNTEAIHKLGSNHAISDFGAIENLAMEVRKITESYSFKDIKEAIDGIS